MYFYKYISAFTDDFYMNFKIIFCVINIQWACDSVLFWSIFMIRIYFSLSVI